MSRYKFLHQTIVLSGLGTLTFKNSLKVANEIYRIFNRQFSEGVLDLWDCSSVDDTNFPCLNLSNHYLMPANKAHGLEATPFHKGVDPRGILQDMMKGDGLTTYIHTEDNQVKYYNMKRDRGENKKSFNHLS